MLTSLINGPNTLISKNPILPGTRPARAKTNSFDLSLNLSLISAKHMSITIMFVITPCPILVTGLGGAEERNSNPCKGGQKPGTGGHCPSLPHAGYGPAPV